MQEITTKELLNLVNTQKLVPDNHYKIIDYKPSYIEGDFVMLGHQFDIIVTAKTNSTIDENVKFSQHFGETYFKNNNIDAWSGKIKLGPLYVSTISKRVSGILYSAYLLKTDNRLFRNKIYYYEYLLNGDIPDTSLLYSPDFPLKTNSAFIDTSGNNFEYDFMAVEKTNIDLEITWMVDEFGNAANCDFKNKFYTWNSSYRGIPKGAHYGFIFGDSVFDRSLTGRY